MSRFDLIKAQLSEAVPFAKHVGIEITHVAAGEAEAALEETPTTVNHISTQHAGALFTLGEAASGAAMAGAFADRLLTVRPVAGEAQIVYKKIARGRLIAKAKTSETASHLIAKFETDGKIAFNVDVSLFDAEENEVAVMTVAWHVKSVQPSAV